MTLDLAIAGVGLCPQAVRTTASSMVKRGPKTDFIIRLAYSYEEFRISFDIPVNSMS